MRFFGAVLRFAYIFWDIVTSKTCIQLAGVFAAAQLPFDYVPWGLCLALVWIVLIHLLMSPNYKPNIRRQVNLQLQGNLSFTEEDSAQFEPRNYAHMANYRLPFEDVWLAANGGVTEGESHSWDIKSQRYAYDFVMVDENGRSSSSPWRRCDSYLCFDRPILAARGGTVVETNDNCRDYPYPGSWKTDWRAPDMRGNYVVIDHGDQEWSVYAHLMKGSIRVTEGQRVNAGEEVGRCGNSGSSTEPHLHFQVQNCQDLFAAHGIPILFRDFIEISRTAEKSVDQGYVQKGSRVRSIGPTNKAPTV